MFSDGKSLKNNSKYKSVCEKTSGSFTGKNLIYVF